MNILITGANGFIGRNLVETLKTIRDGKNRTQPELFIENIFEYTRNSSREELLEYANKADFVFHFAGVNRPLYENEFIPGNCGALETVLDALKAAENPCPVLLASSRQASLEGRYTGSEYGRSKLAAENTLRAYGETTGAKILIYRFPNVFGKWCRPNYNSAVATFCHNIARGLPISVSDPAIELELLYIDDLVEEMLLALKGREHRGEAGFCRVPVTHRATLGQIKALLESFREQKNTLYVPVLEEGSFAKKLYATYLSHLPPEEVAYPLTTNADERGSFTELLKTHGCGQVSVNISRPGVTKGRHWHHTKSEIFAVVSGHGLIRMRRIGGEEVLVYEVSGAEVKAVQMLPGYTHELVNLSDREDLITVIWANESFDPEFPDTFYEIVSEDA